MAQRAIAVVGVGRMGLGVCTRLVQAGFQVVAADTDETRRGGVEALGASWAGSPHTAADQADVLVTVLPGSPEVQTVMTALLPVVKPGTTWIDLTSTSPQIGRALRELASGIDCLDSPMGGDPSAARAGTLELFVGGAHDSVERHRAILEAFGRIHHVGEPGSGYVVKLLVNLLWFGQAVATGEALLLARRAGLDLPTVRTALTNSAAASEFLRCDVGRLLEGDYLTSFGLDRCCEELDAVAEFARELDAPFELSTLVRDIYGRALERYGARDGELLAVALLEETAGIRLSG